MFGDSSGDGIWYSTDRGATAQPLCTEYKCVAISAMVDQAQGAHVIFGTDNPHVLNRIVKLDTVSGGSTDLFTMAYTSYSSLRTGSTLLVAETHEPGVAITDPWIHVYASNDGGATWGSVYQFAILSVDSTTRLQTIGTFPSGDVVILSPGEGTIVVRLDTSPPTGQPPVNVSAPTLSGAAVVGSELTGTTGTWSGSQPLSFAYQWQRCTAGGYAQSVLADDPRGYWRLEESSGTQAADSSGQGRHGSYQGGVALGAAGAVSGSLAASFDGVDDRVEVPGTTALSPIRLSVEAWVRSKTATWDDYGYFVSKRSSYVLHPRQGSSVVDFVVWVGGLERVARWVPPASFDITQWHHYLGSYDGAQVRLYVDGVLRAQLAVAGTAGADGGPLYIGRDDDWPRFGAAFIDEVAVYDKALSDARIAAARPGRRRRQQLQPHRRRHRLELHAHLRRPRPAPAPRRHREQHSRQRLRHQRRERRGDGWYAGHGPPAHRPAGLSPGSRARERSSRPPLAAGRARSRSPSSTPGCAAIRQGKAASLSPARAPNTP